MVLRGLALAKKLKSKKRLVRRKYAQHAGIIDLIEILKHENRFIFAKFIDHFFSSVPEEHRIGILNHIVEEGGNTKWEGMVKDKYEHLNLVKSILWNFSGRPENKKEPNLADLAGLLAEYLRSDEYKRINSEIKGTKSTTELMGEIQ